MDNESDLCTSDEERQKLITFRRKALQKARPAATRPKKKIPVLQYSSSESEQEQEQLAKAKHAAVPAKPTKIIMSSKRKETNQSGIGEIKYNTDRSIVSKKKVDKSAGILAPKEPTEEFNKRVLNLRSTKAPERAAQSDYKEKKPAKVSFQVLVRRSTNSSERKSIRITRKVDMRKSSKAPSQQSSMNASLQLKMSATKSSKSLTTKTMIIRAVANMNERRGSTIAKIKNFLTNNFEVTERRLLMVSKLLKQLSNEDQGWLVRASGHGASSDSRFKLSEETKKNMKLLKKKSEAMDEKEAKKPLKKKEKVQTEREAEKIPTTKKIEPAKMKKAVEATKKPITAAAAKKRAA